MTYHRIYPAFFIVINIAIWANLYSCQFLADCLSLPDEQSKKTAQYTQNAKEVIPLSPILKAYAQECQKVLSKHDVFKIAAVYNTLLAYADDSCLIPYKTLQEQAFMNARGCHGYKAFYLPILQMHFSPDSSQLQAAMGPSQNMGESEYIVWHIPSGTCLHNQCKPYWDVEIEHARPPEKVVAVSPDRSLRALVIHQFYENDAEYPAPGLGAYRPQYQAVVRLYWNYTLKQFLAYILCAAKA